MSKAYLFSLVALDWVKIDPTCAHAPSGQGVAGGNPAARLKPPERPRPFACELVHSCRSLQTLQHVPSLRNTLRGFAKLSSYSWDTDTRRACCGFVQDTSQSRPIKQWAALSLLSEEEGDMTVDAVSLGNKYMNEFKRGAKRQLPTVH